MSENCTDTTQKRSNVSICIDNPSSSTVSIESDSKDESGGSAFDHLYACNSENGDITLDSTAESEVRFQREWLSLHLDLIQQQSEELLNKERTILLLRQENDMLKQRLKSLNQGDSFQDDEFNFSTDQFVEEDITLNKDDDDDMTQDSLPCEEDTKTNIQLLELNCEGTNTFPSAPIVRDSSDEHFINKTINNTKNKGKSTKNGSVIKVRKDLNIKSTPLPDSTTNNKMVSNDSHNNSTSVIELNHSNIELNSSVKSLRNRNKRKRLSSSSSLFSNTDSNTEDKDITMSSRLRKKIRKSVNDEFILTCPDPYVIQSGDPTTDVFTEESDELLDNRISTQTALEVPRWRVKVYTSCYQMEGTENLDDDVFNKRHSRLENDERRRKRWDVQRIREQRIIEKLKQRQERIDSGSRSEEPPEPPSSLWPTLEDIQLIEVTESLPVSAFGCPVPRLAPSEFSLPWVNHNTMKKPTPTLKKSTAKRKSSKR